MTYTFIKNPELIEESYQTEDLLDFSSIINDFKERINKINKNSVVGLIGPYGSGKSTMLYQIYKDKISSDSESKDKTNNNQNSVSEHKQQVEKWFVFDAWQYPERKDLWEGFVLDITRQYNQELFKNTESQIDGNAEKKEKAIAATGVDILATLIPGVSALKNLPYFFQNSPIKKVYDFQELLLDIINTKIKKNIFIIVEDIDRSGDMGVFFLETLKYFIKTQEKNMEYKVIVIVPIGNDTFYRSHPTRESYLKILDYQIPFNPSLINFTNFIEHTIDIDIAVKNFNNEKDELYKEIKRREIQDREATKHAIQATELNVQDPDIPSFEIKKVAYTDESLQKIFMEHIRYLFETMILNERQGTIRDIKSILRKVNSNFNELGKEKKIIDIRILMLFTTIAHFYRGEKNDPCSFSGIHHNSSNSESTVSWVNNTFWGKDFFSMIMHNTLNIDEIKPKEFIIDTVNEEHLIIDNPIDKYEGRCPYYIMGAYFKSTKVHINYLPKDSKL